MMLRCRQLLKLSFCITCVVLLADDSADAGRRRRRCCDAKPSCCDSTTGSSHDAAPAPQPADAAYEEPNAPAAEDDPEAGFSAIFNGKDLEGWQGATEGYEVLEGGVLASKADSGGNLFTTKEYANFALRFEFKLTPGSNNGIALRSPLEGTSAYVGMEIQVLDDTADQYKDLQQYQYHGSIYGVAAAERGHQKPVGEWNEQEIVCNGKHVTVTLNGHVIVDADIEKASTPETLDKQPHPGLLRETGFIGFCGHGAHVEFRNLRVKTLD
ncbi:MAG: DUF1080 domain-containing protein [Planctomycetaceae bacterium]